MSAMRLGIFSGNCLLGICGEPAGFKDMDGKPLHVGDIVQTFTVARREDDDGEWMDFMGDNLTAVVSDEWESTRHGDTMVYQRKSGGGRYYVMGIRSIPMDQPGQWRVRLVKSHRDVIDGEHWPDYGLRYGQAPNATGEQP